MPIDFYGYQFDDPSIARGARQQGLMGMLAGMQQGRQDPNDWAGFLSGAAGGFNQGYQGYLADYLPIYLRQKQEAEAEMERQRQEELAGRRVDYLQPLVERMMGGGGQPPGGDFMGPEHGFGGGPSIGGIQQSIPAATPPLVPEAPSESEFIASLNQGVQAPQAPGLDYTMMPSELFGSQAEYADYLQGQLPQIQKMREAQQAEQEQQEQLGQVNEALRSLGYEGPPIPNMGAAIELWKQYAKPEAEMTPYQQAQVARWGRQDAQGGQGGGLTPSQEFTLRRFLYEDALKRYQQEESPEANADPIFEELPFVPEGIELRGGVATGERPTPEQFGMVLPGTPVAPGPSVAPTGTSPAPKQKTLQPEAAKRQATATNIVQSLKLPDVVKNDPTFLAMIVAELETKTPEQIRRELRLEAQRTGFWLGGAQ